MNVPKHVAIIMDGNGRWATKKGLKRSEGHLEGSKTLEKLAIHALGMGVEVLSVYAFSTDNFKRSKDEVDYLMNLFVKMFKTKFDKFNKKGIKVMFSGRKINLREDVIKSMEEIEEKTKENTSGILNICLNYGGQEEIIDGAIKLAKDINNGIDINNFTREDFYKYLYNELPPIDLLIRTGGEQRVSNFMLYQMSYSEFYFTNTLFPDFDKSELNKSLFMYENRDRRFGGINDIENG
ncbi:MAG: di-trans,poly-cis-decaprenylcistransferase [Firmicutes bacterium]|nr:di-trans,poly-cis-decaprenylcistransferase [Bacillota bacterium]